MEFEMKRMESTFRDSENDFFLVIKYVFYHWHFYSIIAVTLCVVASVSVIRVVIVFAYCQISRGTSL